MISRSRSEVLTPEKPKCPARCPSAAKPSPYCVLLASMTRRSATRKDSLFSVFIRYDDGLVVRDSLFFVRRSGHSRRVKLRRHLAHRNFLFDKYGALDHGPGIGYGVTYAP